MSIAALNAQLGRLAALFKAIASQASAATSAVQGGDLLHYSPSGPHGLKTVTDILPDVGGASGGDALHLNPGSDSLHYLLGDEMRGRSVLPSRRGLSAGARVVAQAKKEIDEHVENTTRRVNDAVDDAITKIVDTFNFSDEAIKKTLAYVATRENQGIKGIDTIVHLSNILKDLNRARDRGDAIRMAELMDQFEGWIRFINDMLIGWNDPNFTGVLSSGRLLSSFGRGKRPPKPTKTSTSSLSSQVSNGSISGGF